jgi:hypothetical protein
LMALSCPSQMGTAVRIRMGSWGLRCVAVALRFRVVVATFT